MQITEVKILIKIFIFMNKNKSCFILTIFGSILIVNLFCFLWYFYDLTKILQDLNEFLENKSYIQNIEKLPKNNNIPFINICANFISSKLTVHTPSPFIKVTNNFIPSNIIENNNTILSKELYLLSYRYEYSKLYSQEFIDILLTIKNILGTDLSRINNMEKLLNYL